MTETRPGAAARAYSSLKMTCWVMVAPRPPCSTGHPRQVHPPSARTFSHRRRTSKPKVSSPEPPRPPSSANSPTRFSSRKPPHFGAERHVLRAVAQIHRPGA